MTTKIPYLAPQCEEITLSVEGAILGDSIFGEPGRPGNYDSGNDTDYGIF